MSSSLGHVLVVQEHSANVHLSVGEMKLLRKDGLSLSSVWTVGRRTVLPMELKAK